MKTSTLITIAIVLFAGIYLYNVTSGSDPDYDVVPPPASTDGADDSDYEQLQSALSVEDEPAFAPSEPLSPQLERAEKVPVDPDDPSTWATYEGPQINIGPPRDADDPSTWSRYEGPQINIGPDRDPDDPTTWSQYTGEQRNIGISRDPDDASTWSTYDGEQRQIKPWLDADDPQTWSQGERSNSDNR